ncbi:MAG: 2-dehydropantoate 2-reductase [Blastocatellia bacterium]|nr:2-dehydropantoate 2-reductase [Blastocatellia bacterium]
MYTEKPTRYIIFGAGAMGGVVGGFLARAGLRVTCVARPAQAGALNRGLIIKEAGEEIRVQATAVTSAEQIVPERGDLVIIMVKSQSTERAVEELSAVYDKETPVVCLQNGIRNEEIVRKRFERVYAGLLMWSAVQVKPEEILLAFGRETAIGCYPAGVDSLARHCSEDLARAGFETLASAHVMPMKWGKLITNLNNATHAITGYWLERGMSDTRMRELMVAVREEGLRVLDAAGIEAEPPPGAPSQIRIREMTEKLRRPPRSPSTEDALPPERRTYASMWQDLYLGRKTSEIDFLNGEIIELGKKHGIPTPYNSTLVEVINRMIADGLKPGLYTPTELHALVRTKQGGVHPPSGEAV